MKNNNKTSQPAPLPLSETTIPTALADIRRRCSDLLDENGDIRLSLEDERERAVGGFNPYDRSPSGRPRQ